MTPNPLATFRVYPERKSLFFTVKVWRTLGDLRKANPRNHRTLGLCRSLKRRRYGRLTPEVGEVHFSKNRLGVGIVSHEFTHAAIGWAARKGIRPDFEDVTVGQFKAMPNNDPEEQFCRALGWMVAQCVDHVYRLKILK